MNAAELRAWRDAFAERFWARVDVRGPHECWAWTGATSSGYGQVRVAHQTVRAHVVALSLAEPPRGEEHYSRSRPDSLCRGSRSPHAKLSEDDVRDIRAAASASHADLSRRFGVSSQVIRLIRLRRAWRHVSDEIIEVKP